MGSIKKPSPGKLIVTLDANELLTKPVYIRAKNDSAVFTLPQKTIGEIISLLAHQIVLEKAQEMLYDCKAFNGSIVNIADGKFSIELSYDQKEG